MERHGVDWQGIKEPYQLELMPWSKWTGRDQAMVSPHAIRTKDAFWPWMGASCWTIQMPFWAKSSRGEACPTMKFRWQRHT